MSDKTRSVGWRMPEELYKNLLRLAGTDNRSFSNMLEMCVKLGVDEYRRGKTAKTGDN